MGWFSDLFKKKEEPKQTTYADMPIGGAPLFSQFGTDIYASDVVQQAIACIVSEMKKLAPTHIRENGTDIVPVNDSLQTVLNDPNPLMTTSDFIEKVVWLWYLNYNAFIIPTYYEWREKDGTTKRRIESLYPIQPAQVDFIEDAGGHLFVKFRFGNGYISTVKYSDVIHLKMHYSVNPYMGGNAGGQPDNDALLKTLNINHQLLQGVAAGMKASYAVNAVVRYNTLLDDGKTEKALKELEAKLKKSEHGFLPMDLQSEFIPIQKDLKMVDDEMLKFIDTKILRHFGVPLSILTGDYTPEQYEAFYQKTLEPLIISLSQAFTKVLFTPTERSHGNTIKFYPKELIFMSMDQTLQMVTLLSNTGAMYENEKRVAFGLKPLKELEGIRKMSLNWVDVDIANQYQAGQVGNGGQNNDGE